MSDQLHWAPLTHSSAFILLPLTSRTLFDLDGPDEPAQPAPPPVLTVSQLTAQIKEVLEGEFASVIVSGEISNFSRPQSGHCYLTLKDDQAQLRAVCWKATAQRMKVDLHDGLEVICHGYLDLYAPRGSYQLVIQHIEPKGRGALEQALLKLKEKLTAEGLFRPERKRPLPKFPRRVAFVTSPTGAAIRDFLEILHKRWRGVDVLVVPARVQGDGAAQEIAAAIAKVNKLEPAIDVLVVGRGGGSLEDLWAFNEEVVVRAIYASRIPVVSAVGHEIDVTLSDLVADLRAATPSEAAQRVVPEALEVAAAVRRTEQRLRAALLQRAKRARTVLDHLARSRVFRRPKERIHLTQQRLDEIAARLSRLAKQRIRVAKDQLGAQAAHLQSLSPLATLGRGYSLTMANGRLVRSAAELKPGDELTTRLAQGEAVSRVEQVRESPADSLDKSKST